MTTTATTAPALRTISTVAVAICGAFFAIYCVVVLVAPAETTAPRSYIAAGVLAVLVAVAALVLRRTRVGASAGRFVSDYPWVARLLCAMAVAALFAAEVAIGRAVTETTSAWDVDVIRLAATQVGSTGTIDPGLAGYFASFSINNGVVLFTGSAIALARAVGFTDSTAVLIVLNSLLLTATVVVTVALARRVFGTSAAVAAALLSAVLVGLSPWVAVSYTDTIGVLFPILGLYFGYRAYTGRRTASRVAFAAAFALAIAVGAFIKSSALVLAIAAVIVAVIAFVFVRGARRVLAATVLTGVAVLVIVSTTLSGVGDRIMLSSLGDAAPAMAMPVEYFALIGLSDNADQDPHSWGSWNAADVLMMDAVPDVDDKRTLARSVIVDRLEAMGPAGYAGFLSAKARWVLSDGTFGLLYEGNRGATNTTFTDPVSTTIRSAITSTTTPFTFGTLAQATWLIALGAVGTLLISAVRRRVGLIELYAALTLGGMIAYTLVGEGRARYLFIFAPVIALIAARAFRGRREPGARHDR